MKKTKPTKPAARQYPPLASLISPELRAEAAAATVDGRPLFPLLVAYRRNRAA